MNTDMEKIKQLLNTLSDGDKNAYSFLREMVTVEQAEKLADTILLYEN